MLLNPFPPLGQLNSIAFCSHAYQQALHSMQYSNVVIFAFFPEIEKHPAKQTFKQFPHPIHSSSLIFMKFSEISTHSTPGNSFEVLTNYESHSIEI